ncbi:alkaline phosphatase family protein [Kitasatospora purpeofusca]|uniref:alkaline phosphatase D family protein n=1 Tax=Kitasatospora purpeofusca TaxID=67352 RepID=UPI002258E089|nr:alkaline phosphatase D family protein [Kitasatospora purpeofusca]MCX4682884.1 alkaline phosphatase family protein [Kitasatospora purpeofusca]
MDDSSPTLSDSVRAEISRRRAVQLLGVGAAAVAAGSAMTGTAAAAVAPLPSSGLRAAVLEYADRWTNAVGLRTLLEHAGFTVIDLDLTKAPDAQAQAVDLIAFGSFTNDSTNNTDPYGTYVKAHTDSLRRFVRAGGVVLDLAKSDEPGVGVPYLPIWKWDYNSTAMFAVRTDADFNTVYRVATAHPLVSVLPADASGQVFAGRSVTASWESLGAWKEMRVLLACVSGTSGYPAALLEGKDKIVAADGKSSVDGKGRYLVSSLTIDKCYNTAGAPTQSEAAIDDSRRFFNALTGYVKSAKAGSAPSLTATPSLQAGPLVGHVSETTAQLWARPGADPGTYPTWKCEVKAGGVAVKTVPATLSTASDSTLLIDVSGLQANTAYTFEIMCTTAAAPAVPMKGSFRTAPAAGAAAKVSLGVGSCAHNVPNHLWKQVMTEGCDGFVMLGDTPYADMGLSGASSELDRVRRHHRDFLAVPEIARMVSSMPIWGTWDDHDFAGNDTDGRSTLKTMYREAFVDYRANANFGHVTGGTDLLTGRGPGEGIYTSFRRGPIEVFLIDPRWFSNTSTGVCMETVQSKWLKDALKASTATFKVLASGMVWYDKITGEKDDWNTYKNEKLQLLDLIKTERISGCVMLSGDIHVSRAVKNFDGTPADPKPAGYDMWEYVVSPVHDWTIGSQFDVTTSASTGLPQGTRWTAHPADPVKWSKDAPYTFLKLTADTTVTPATLTAKWINRDGAVLHTQTCTITELTRP